MYPYRSIQAQHERLREHARPPLASWQPFAIIPTIWAVIYLLGIYGNGLLVPPFLSVAAIVIPFVISALCFVIYHAPQSFTPLLRRTLTCPDCNTKFPFNVPWVCGHCKMEHREFGRLFEPAPTYVERCPRCQHRPHSLWCYKCERPMIFDMSSYQVSPDEMAYFLSHPPKAAPRVDTLDERRERIKRAWR
jgi:hypothetical protein